METETVAERSTARSRSTAKHRIFLADDHVTVRAGLKTLLNAEPDLEVVGEAADGPTAIEGTKHYAPEVAVLDLSLPLLSGTLVARQLRQSCPETKIVALTVHEDKSYLSELLEIGAAGYVLKRAAADELISAIRQVLAGGIYIDPRLGGLLANSLLRRRASTARSGTTALSDRESEVLRLIAQGHSNKEIAARLNLSVKTIETYKTRSMEKVGLRSRIDIVRYASRHGWLQNI
jgi:two-component system response regulator NreC